MKSIYHTHSPEETMQLAERLAAYLEPGSILLLFGDLGSGKTHFAKGVAKGLGIEEVIKSPTFAYVNEYQLSKPLPALSSQPTAFYHYDLYRLQSGESTHSIGLQETLDDPQAINLIEWADRLGDDLPQNYLSLKFESKADYHEISVEWHDPRIVPETQVQTLWEAWVTPQHVRRHCEQVAKAALRLGQALVESGQIVDLNSLNTAALLHDVARVCDFIEMDKSKFDEPISEEKWEKWLALRKQYAGRHHADIGAEALSKLGHTKTAELVRLHHSLAILDQADALEHLEAAILYYADKRVCHDRVVSLAERFEEGRQRYGEHDDEVQKARYLDVEQACLALEKRLFEGLSIKPSDLASYS